MDPNTNELALRQATDQAYSGGSYSDILDEMAAKGKRNVPLSSTVVPPTGAARKALVPTGRPTTEFAGATVVSPAWWEELLARFKGAPTPQGDHLVTPVYRPTGAEALGTGPSMFAGDTKAVGPAIVVPEAVVKATKEATKKAAKKNPDKIAEAEKAPKGVKPKGRFKRNAALALGSAMAGALGYDAYKPDPYADPLSR